MAPATTVRFTIADSTGTVVTNRKCLIGPLDAPLSSGGRMIARDTIARTTDATGVFYVSNLVAQTYAVQILAPPALTTFYLQVTNSTAVLEAQDLQVALPADATTTYTKAQIDAWFAAVAGNAAGDSRIATNDSRAVVLTNTASVFVGRVQLPFGASVDYVWTCTNADGSGTWRVPGSGAQSPWTGDVNGAAFALTNVASLRLTNGPLEIVARRAPGAASHSYDLLRLHYGNPVTNAYWGTTVSSFTNNNDPFSNSFDSVLQEGFNLPGFATYNSFLPTVGFGWEDNYVTAQGIRQSELYLVFSRDQAHPHARPWGWSLIHDQSGSPFILHNWNIEQFEMNAGNQLAAITFTQTGPNGITQTLQRDSQLSFNGNTRGDGMMIADWDNQGLVRRGAYGMPVFGARKSAASNALNFLQYDLASTDQYLLLGDTNSYTAIRWNHNSNRLEYAANAGGAALSNLSFRPFNDFSAGVKSFYQSFTLSGTPSNTYELGVYTNASFQGAGVLQLDLAVYNAQGSQRYVIPFNLPDCQNTSAWRECLPAFSAPDTAAPRLAVDFTGLALDSCKFRVRQLGTNSLTIRATITLYGDSASTWINTGTTGTAGTVSGYHRHKQLSQMLGRWGLGTNNPQAELHVAGAALVDNFTNTAVRNALAFHDANGGEQAATITNLLSTLGYTPQAASLTLSNLATGDGAALANVTAANLAAPDVTTWAGPTNPIAVSYPWTDYTYGLTSDAQITALSGWVSGKRLRFVLHLVNNAGSNCTIRFPASWQRYGVLTSNALVVTNAAFLSVTAGSTTNVAAAYKAP